MRVLITGITGFAGSYLAKLLLRQQKAEVHGLARQRRWLVPGMEHLQDAITLHCIDLQDVNALRRAIWLIQPDEIYHLAAYTNIGQSFHQSNLAWEANLDGTLFLYDACLSELKNKPRIVFISTGAVYGEADPNEVITESTVLRPMNPYATSKASADLASYQYFAQHGLPIIRIRPFNQAGPGQSTDFALGRFADLLVRIEQNELPAVMPVGNLETERDFTDVRDMVRAYELLMRLGVPGEVYNAASGISRPMRWYLNQLINISRVEVQVEVDSALLRPTETKSLRVSCGRLHQKTAWETEIPMHQTLADMLSLCRLHYSRQDAAAVQNP